jgi:proline iminopeptidase
MQANCGKEMFKYPEIKAFKEEMLPVSDLHTISVEQYGTQGAKPVLFVHGGPGAGCSPDYARFFNPEKYWIILVDQRGCGKSTPHASLENNKTKFLIEDFEKIRKYLGIDQWMLCGGSWGSTLSLAYSQQHPEVVSEMVLRGIFLSRPEEINWLFQDHPGAKTIFPDAWEDYAALVPEHNRNDMLGYYYKLLTCEDEALKLKAAQTYVRWELSISKLFQDQESIAMADNAHFCLPFARLEAHYLNQGCFLEPSQLLNNADKIKDIPLVIVQGRYDVVCPVQSAWDLHKALPESKLVIIQDAGHSTVEAGIIKAITAGSDHFVDN